MLRVLVVVTRYTSPSAATFLSWANPTAIVRAPLSGRDQAGPGGHRVLIDKRRVETTILASSDPAVKLSCRQVVVPSHQRWNVVNRGAWSTNVENQRVKATDRMRGTSFDRVQIGCRSMYLVYLIQKGCVHIAPGQGQTFALCASSGITGFASSHHFPTPPARADTAEYS